MPGPYICVSKNLPLGGRWPEGPEGESLTFARNLRACVKLSPPPPAGGAPSQRGPRSFLTRRKNIIFSRTFPFSNKGFHQRDAYRVMLRKYPAVLNIEHLTFSAVI